MRKLLYNARIYTLNPQQPQATALLIDHGRVLAVGDDRLLQQTDEATPREDINGRTIWPGLADAHIHLRHFAFSLQKIDCEGLSQTACLEKVRQRAAQTRRGAWILGHGWDQNLWPGWGNRQQLDAVAPEHPVFLTAKSLHAAWVNSAALQQAGIDRHTPDPPGGHILRAADGTPNGILLENAISLLAAAIPNPSPRQAAAAIAAAQEILWSYGITSVHDFDGALAFRALQHLHQEGRLRLRVIKNIPHALLPAALNLGLQTHFGDRWLRIGALKVFMDGALGPRTAAMCEPYNDAPQNKGLLLLDEQSLYEIGRQAVAGGIPLAIHAIGDQANHEALQALARLRAEGDTSRHRIEHVQLLSPADRHRLGALQIIASMQPAHLLSDMETADRAWGQRTALAYAWRTQEESGATLAFGSDAPVETPNPFLGLYAAITRRRPDGFPAPAGWHPQEKLSLFSALQAYTTGAALAGGWESWLCRLHPGYAADLIVLPDDPFSLPDEALLQLRPQRVMVGGEWVWQQD